MTGEPTVFETHAAWVLVVTFVLSFLYELWRATAKAGTSRHDTMRGLLLQVGAAYLPATVVIGMLFAGTSGAAWVGLVLCAVSIGISVFYYNPVIMLERKPGIIDWVEDLVFTGLLFVAAALLLYEATGFALENAS
jgi:phosphatidylserine synthase